jgi:hypothetical protein
VVEVDRLVDDLRGGREREREGEREREREREEHKNVCEREKGVRMVRHMGGE